MRIRVVAAGVTMALLLAACGARFKGGGGGQATGGEQVASESSQQSSTGNGTGGGGTAPAAGGASPIGADNGAISGPVVGTTGSGSSSTGTGSTGPGVLVGGPGATSTDIGSTQGVTPTQVTVALLIPQTGAAPVPDTIGPAVKVAWDYVNRHGGINGRQIKLNIYDTTSTTTGAKTAAQKAVEDDKVFVIVMLDRLEIQDAVAQYLQTKNFPNIEVQLPANTPATEDWTFGLNVDHARQGALIADYLVKVMGLKRLGLCTEQQIQLAPGRNAFVREAAALGASVVYNDQIDGNGNDFSGNVLKAQQSRAQAVWLYMAPTPAVKYVNEAQSVAFHPTWFANSISWAFNLTLTGGAAWQGAKAFSEWPTLDDPRTATYKQAYADYNQRTGGTNRPDDLGVAAWGYTEIVAEALREAGRNLGQLAFKRVMSNLRYQAADRMWAPLAFGPGVRIGTNEVDVYRVGSINGSPAWQLERDYTASF